MVYIQTLQERVHFLVRATGYCENVSSYLEDDYRKFEMGVQYSHSHANWDLMREPTNRMQTLDLLTGEATKNANRSVYCLQRISRMNYSLSEQIVDDQQISRFTSIIGLCHFKLVLIKAVICSNLSHVLIGTLF